MMNNEAKTAKIPVAMTVKDPELMAEIHKYIDGVRAEQGYAPTVSDVVRLAVRRYLAGEAKP